VQVVEDNLLQLLLNLLRLPKDDAPFPLDCRFLQLGVLEDILENINALGDILVQSLGKVDGVLALPGMSVAKVCQGGVKIGRTEV